MRADDLDTERPAGRTRPTQDGREHGTRWQLVSLPQVPEPRGNLTFVEAGVHVPFAIARAYWIYDVPGGERRTGHAYRRLEELIVALSGSFSVVLDDGEQTESVMLNRSYHGLYVPAGVWRRLEDFSTNGVCLVLASLPYDERDYIRDHDEFVAFVRERAG